jgi:hypothetical protein
MKRIFRLILRLYPSDWQQEFGAEMLAVLDASSVGAQFPHLLHEGTGLLLGALRARCQHLRIPPLAVGLLIAALTQWLLYTMILRVLPLAPHPEATLDRYGQLALGLMAVAVLLVIIPLTVLLTRGIQRPARKPRFR